VNTAGVEGPLSPPMDGVTQNYNTPESPANLAAVADGICRIRVSWDAVTRNTASIPDGAFLDFAGYRLYRSTSSGSGPDPANLLLGENVLGEMGSPALTDDKAVSCRAYYYVVTAVDDCGVESEPSAEVSGQVSSTANIVVPTGVNAFFDGTDVRVRWDRVREDVDGNPVWVEDYRIYRAGPLLVGSDPPVVPIDFAQIATVQGDIEFREPRPSPGYESWYAVEAVDDCGNDSGPSTPALASCTFHGEVRFNRPRYGEEYGSPMHIEVYVDNPVGSYDGLRVTFRNEDDLSTYTRTWGGPGPVWVYDMSEVPDGAFTPGWYTLTAEVDQLDGTTLCTDSTVTRARLR